MVKQLTPSCNSYLSACDVTCKKEAEKLGLIIGRGGGNQLHPCSGNCSLINLHLSIHSFSFIRTTHLPLAFPISTLPHMSTMLSPSPIPPHNNNKQIKFKYNFKYFFLTHSLTLDFRLRKILGLVIWFPNDFSFCFYFLSFNFQRMMILLLFFLFPCQEGT